VVEANALATESVAVERGISTEAIAQTEALALHAAAFKRDARSGVSSDCSGDGDCQRPGRDRT